MKDLGYGKGYKLAHHEEHKVAAGMRCLPDSLAGRTYYQPTEEGRESWLKERLEQVKAWRGNASEEGETLSAKALPC